ncbi:hypothetical protein DFH07DRAFT_967036 [Mycena maculata]|uniref:Uncharacterized protein n=1 Tax=Mycena maculata TaxID=230809 RepID=A0AAD7I5X1_9AGAR|nr:hypothetical protein DFH07DRAFT_967036 [Mycena maculata]
MPSETAAANPPSTDAAASQPPLSASLKKPPHPSVQNVTLPNKRAKHDTFESKSPLEQLPSITKCFVRAVNPYLGITLVLHYGCQGRWGSLHSLSHVERAEAKIHVDAFHKCWQKLFCDAASNACQGDTTGLKHKLNYLLADTTLSLTPKINENTSKSARGRNHPMLRDAIVPWPLHILLNERDAPEPDAEPVPTPRAVTALKSLMKGKSTDGKDAPTASQYPSCFYAESPFDPKAPSKGLFS